MQCQCPYSWARRRGYVKELKMAVGDCHTTRYRLATRGSRASLCPFRFAFFCRRVPTHWLAERTLKGLWLEFASSGILAITSSSPDRLPAELAFSALSGKRIYQRIPLGPHRCDYQSPAIPTISRPVFPVDRGAAAKTALVCLVRVSTDSRAETSVSFAAT